MLLLKPNKNAIHQLTSRKPLLLQSIVLSTPSPARLLYPRSGFVQATRWAASNRKRFERPEFKPQDAPAFADQNVRRRKVNWREDIKVMLTVLALLAGIGALIEAEHVKVILQGRIDQIKDRLIRRNDIRDIGLRWLQDIVTDPVTKDKVDTLIKQLLTQHIGTIRDGLVNGLMQDQQFVDAVVDWSKEQAVAVCQDPETVNAMTELMQEAIERPETLRSAQEVIENLTRSPETECLVRDFVVRTASDSTVQSELAKAGRGTLESLANDQHIQEALSSSLWNITRKALVPRWLAGTPESEATVTAVQKLKRRSREVAGKSQGSSLIATPVASYEQANNSSVG